MKVLLDSCIWGGVRPELEAAGHEVIWAGDWDQDPGDEEILAAAHREGRILVTLDKDFGELAIVFAIPHSGILRLVGHSARRQSEACERALSLHGLELSRGAIVTVERSRIRVRPPEPQTDQEE